MSKLLFRLASVVDKPLIVSFMDAYWGQKHPLVHNEEMFRHYYVDKEILQFGLCFEGDALIALCGYIKTNNSKTPDIWASIWCAKKGKNGAGLELMANMPSLCNCRVMACNNIRQNSMPFYTFLGYTTKRLPHFYRLANKKNYAVCKIQDNTILTVSQGEELIRVDSLDDVYAPSLQRIPYKDQWYLQRRYFEYPLLEYDVWRLASQEQADSLLVTRTVDVEGIKILRVVDYTGDPLQFAKLGYGIDTLMKKANAEYAEMYCYGISSEIMATAGFCEREENSVNIIPNYLTPLLQENTEYYFFTNNDNGFTMFKADGDQDRPNIAY